MFFNLQPPYRVQLSQLSKVVVIVYLVISETRSTVLLTKS